MISIVSVKPFRLHMKDVKNYCFFCRGMKISLRSSNLIIDSSCDTYIPIFLSLRLTNPSVNSDKQTNPSVLIYKIHFFHNISIYGVHSRQNISLVFDFLNMNFSLSIHVHACSSHLMTFLKS